MRLFLASCVLLALGADLVAAGPAASASASAPPRDGARRGRGRARGRAAPAQILRDADADADADADVVVAQQAAGPASSPTLATPIFDPTTQDIGDASAFIEDARRRAERIASDEVRDAVNDLYAPILDRDYPDAGEGDGDGFTPRGFSRWLRRGREGDRASFGPSRPVIGESVVDALELSDDILSLTAPGAASAAESGFDALAEVAGDAAAAPAAETENDPDADRAGFDLSDLATTQPTPSELEAIAGSAQIASKVAAAMNNAATAAYQRATTPEQRAAVKDAAASAAAATIQKTLEMQATAPVGRYVPGDSQWGVDATFKAREVLDAVYRAQRERAFGGDGARRSGGGAGGEPSFDRAGVYNPAGDGDAFVAEVWRQMRLGREMEGEA